MNKTNPWSVLVSMRFLWVFLVAAPLWAKQVDKPQVLPLREGPVKAALKKNYKIHLVRNFTAEAERELDKKVGEKWTTKLNK